MATRLPTHLVVGGLIRAVEAAGGFATVIGKGERDAGTLLVVCCDKDRPAAAFELMPHPDGGRTWTETHRQNTENPQEFWDYCERRKKQDRDLWIVELDIAGAERFIDSLATGD